MCCPCPKSFGLWPEIISSISSLTSHNYSGDTAAGMKIQSLSFDHQPWSSEDRRGDVVATTRSLESRDVCIEAQKITETCV